MLEDFQIKYVFKSANQSSKTFTDSNVDGNVAVAIDLVPDSSTWTPKLTTARKPRPGIPDSTLDVLVRVVVCVVVTVRLDVVVGTRVGEEAAELSNYNTASAQLASHLPRCVNRCEFRQLLTLKYSVIMINISRRVLDVVK